MLHLAAFPLLLILSGAPPDAGTSATPEAEVKALIAAQVAAWNRGDIAAFCEPYAEDASFVSPSGFTRGRLALVERYKKHYPDRAAMGSLTIEPLETRVLPPEGSPGAVTLVGRWTLAYPDKAPASGLTLLVFRPRPGGWQIVQDASM
jgi:uncharacterized protein (TIGR02246 family)